MDRKIRAALELPFDLFWRGASRVLEGATAAEIKRRYDTAWVVIRAYYAYVSFTLFLYSSRAARAWVTAEKAPVKLELTLMDLVPREMWLGAALLAAAGGFAGATVAAWKPDSRWARISSILGFVFYAGFEFAWKGKVDHGHHAALWVGFALCLLPTVQERTEESEKRWLAGFFAAQLWIGLLYSCAGLCKVLGVFYDWGEGVTWLNPDALPLTIAENWPKSRETLLGGWLTMHPMLAWSMNIGALLVELFAAYAVLRPHLHRVWGAAIILLHFSIAHSMAIHFHQSVIIVALFLVASPFSAAFDWRKKADREPATSHRSGERIGPTATWVRYATPLAMTFYLVVAFSRLKVDDGEWETDVYPISAQWMYWRIDSGERNVKHLAKIRKDLEDRGLYPARDRQEKRGKKRSRRGK